MSKGGAELVGYGGFEARRREGRTGAGLHGVTAKWNGDEKGGERRVQGAGGVHPSISIPRWLLGL